MHKRIVRVVEAQGRTLTWLAGQLGITYHYLYMITTGRRPEPAWFRQRVSVALGVPESLLFDAQDMTDSTKLVASGK